MSPDYYSGINSMSLAIYLPLIVQIVAGLLLVAAGALMLVLGHRAYNRRRNKKR